MELLGFLQVDARMSRARSLLSSVCAGTVSDAICQECLDLAPKCNDQSCLTRVEDSQNFHKTKIAVLFHCLMLGVGTA